MNSEWLRLSGWMVVSAMICIVVGCGAEQPEQDARPVVESIELYPPLLTLAVDESLNINVELVDGEGDEVVDANPSWSVDDDAVVHIDADGEITGVEPGEATLSAEIDDARATMAVEVRQRRWRDVATGPAASCATDWEGELYCWGLDSTGVLGNPRAYGWMASRPTPVPLDAPVGQVTMGHSHYCAWDDNGETFCWGYNIIGEVGVQADGNIHAPVVVEGWQFDDVQAGQLATCGLTGDDIYCWGNNRDGLLGRPDVDDSHEPLRVVVDEPMSGLSMGLDHACGVADAGSVYCWGTNAGGAVDPNGDADDVLLPRRIELQQPAVAVAAGADFSCALTDERRPVCWGANEVGELGHPPVDEGETVEPHHVETNYRFLELEAAGRTVCGRTEVHELICWGGNYTGTLGDGTYTDRAEPRPVFGPDRWAASAAGYLQSCGIDLDGQLWCWGTNTFGEAGDGRPTIRSDVQPVDSHRQFERVAAGETFVCGTDDAGDNYCWGRNDRGQLQAERPLDRSSPTPLREWSPDVVVPGGSFGCGIEFEGGDRAGPVRCWGANDRGQLGRGSEEESVDPEPQHIDMDGRFVDLDAAADHICGVDETGDLYCWGANEVGQLGEQTGIDQNSPMQLDIDAEFKRVATGDSHSCAVTEEHDIYCWGTNQAGQLGHGDITSFEFADEVIFEEDFIDVDVDDQYSCGLVVGGDIHCWGHALNFTGAWRQAFVEETIVFEGPWGTFDAGERAMCGVRDNQVFCSGYNWNGWMSTRNRNDHIAGMLDTGDETELTDVSVGPTFLCAVADTGDVLCQGTTYYGVLGDGAPVDYTTPNRVDDE